MRVIGIDPGLRRTGYGVCEVVPGCVEPRLVEAGLIRLRQGDSLEDRLLELATQLGDLVKDVQPTHAAVEALYAHPQWPATAIIMGHARGVILLELRRAGLAVESLEASVVKRALTGSGRASKEQVQGAVAAQLGLAAVPEPPDVADALAIAWTHARRLALAAMA